jgi:pseudouridine-5'-phosphate glycosidase
LQELARTSVAVVCAGAKSILDLGLTLEYLETHGVPVVSVGQAEFPHSLPATAVSARIFNSIAPLSRLILCYKVDAGFAWRGRDCESGS